jgi:hypothetical protein
MTNNVNDYALLEEHDPLEECIDWFWSGLNEEEVYPKEFLEYLLQISDDVRTGKVETYEWDEWEKDLELLDVDSSETDP